MGVPTHGPISAKLGYLKVATYGGALVLIPDCRNIRFEKVSEEQIYGGSSTAGRRRRIPGYQDYVLSFDIYAQGGVLHWTHDEGAYITVEGYTATGVGIKGTFLIGRITGIDDIEGGTLVGLSVECGGDGAPGLEAI